MTIFEIITLIIQFVSALFVLGGLIYAGKQISLLKQTHKQNHDWNRRIETQKALNEYNRITIAPDLNREFDHINAKHPIPVDTVLNKFRENQELQTQCHSLLNSYEAFARGIHQGIYDEEIIRSARKTAIIRTYTAYKEYVAHRQRENNPKAYKELESLILKWEKKTLKPDMKNKLGNVK